MHFKKKGSRIEIIEYLAIHWNEEIPAKDIAAKFQYSERSFCAMFKETFGLPFIRYMTRLKIHRAALRISKTQNILEAGRLAGYATVQSFSKAFRKELGVSPRQFLKSNMEVPDMPICFNIMEEPVSLNYVTTGKKAVYGNLIYVNRGKDCSFLKAGSQCNNYFEWEDETVAMDELGEVWWNDEQGNVLRMTGKYLSSQPESHIGRTIITLPKDYYAVFSVSYEKTENQTVLSDIIKEILDYANREWSVINDKEIRQMGYLFICYKDGKIHIHIPIHKRAIGMQNQAPKFRGAAAWVQYIDDNICRNLTVQNLAEAFNYSERHFTDSFEMYFSIRPGLYMKKRKLYLAARELKHGQKAIEKIVSAYGFPSIAAFRKGFYEEFSCYPEEYDGKEYRAENPKQYYQDNKNEIRITMVEEENMIIAGRNVTAEGEEREDQGDLIESIAWYLCYDFGEKKDADEWNEKIVVWQTAKDRDEHYCLVGQRLETEDQFPMFHPGLYEKVCITGGTYAVLETTNDSDLESLASTYRRMYRCAFGGWLRENREKADLSRLTFVKYKKEKLYFYIPIYS